MTFFVKPFHFSDRQSRNEVAESYLENYIAYSSITQVPFSYSELMRMPIKQIMFIYKTVQKEFERKSKAMNDQMKMN